MTAIQGAGSRSDDSGYWQSRKEAPFAIVQAKNGVHQLQRTQKGGIQSNATTIGFTG